MRDEAIIEALDSMFTLCFTIERDLTIREPSRQLAQKLAPEWNADPDLHRVFALQRPRDLTRFSQLAKFQQTTFLLVSSDERFALRGQLVKLPDSGLYRFVGAPWLAWLSENNRADEFQLSDYPNIDSQLDQRFLVASQDLMVKDLESLTRELTRTKEVAERANKVRSDMFAVMSHEMRTPLNGVISALTLIQDPRHESEQDQLHAMAQESANNLLNVINYALDFAKVDAGRMELENQVFHVRDLINSTLDIIKVNATTKGLSVTSEIDTTIPAYLNGDAQRIRQILINLLGNAVKFTEEGTVHLSLQSAKKEQSLHSSEPLQLRFSVIDTGPGIPDHQQDRIFEAFWSEQDDGRREKSTGLGLAICKQLAELMNGDISVSSSPGKGASFHVDIPIRVAAAPQQQPGKDNVEQLPGSFEGRALIVDDNQTNLMLAEMILKDLGIAVRCASSGQEAIDIASTVPFDLVLMDISMPEIDGVEATRQINAGHMRPPIIALTAHTRDGLVQEYLSAGFKGYLSKPLIRQELIKELMLWLPATRKDTPMLIENSRKPLLNQTEVHALIRQIGTENFLLITEQFEEECRQRLHELISAWVRRDMEALSLQAHTLSSSVASFGGDDLTWRLRKIDLYTQENRVTGIIAYMKDIEEITLQFLELLKEFTHEVRQQETKSA